TLLRFENSAYATFDAAIGVAKDAWNVQFFGQNLADKNASVYTSSAQFTEAQTVIRREGSASRLATRSRLFGFWNTARQARFSCGEASRLGSSSCTGPDL